MSQQDEPRWATAYHEAGQCVAGLVTGEHPTKSSIVAGDNYEGATWFDEEDVEALLADVPPYEAAEWHIIRAFAGPIAEHRYTGGDVSPGACDDHAQALELLMRLTAQSERLNDALVARTNAILDEQWPAVGRVAAALFKHLTIDKEAIQKAAHVKGGRNS